jgi:hypothetical protein
MDARAVMMSFLGNRTRLCLAIAIAPALAFGQGTLETDRPTFENDEIHLAYEFVWGGPAASGGFVPIRLEIENPLNDDQGIVTVTAGTYVMRYPIEMPSRTRRSFIVYLPSGSGFYESTIELSCRQTYLKATVDPLSTPSPDVLDIGLISDSPSLVTFLRTVKYKPESGQTIEGADLVSFRDFVSLPGKAPDRSIGYQGIRMLVLYEGAERLTDAEVQAVQRYVLAGGTVLLTGGAVSPILRDPRWAAFVPGTDPVVVNMEGCKTIEDVTGVPMRDTMTVTKLTPAPGTTGLMEDGVPVLWYRSCGLGMVAYWAFDPFQAPMRTYPARGKLFAETMLGISRAAEEYKNEIGVGLPTMSEDLYMYSYSSPDYNDSDAGSVFRIAMPPTSTVFLVLALYFVVVVPVNFIVLGKLGKGQLAWVTSPIIGLAFAGVFFYVARDLYGAALSRSTKALVVAHEGSANAYATANQQMFFPSGGRYDLKLDGVESVSTTTDYMGDYYGGPQRDTGFAESLVDVGHVVATSAGVSNLSFREMHVEQAVAWPHRLPLSLTFEGSGTRAVVKGAFTNDSPFELSNVGIWTGTGYVVLGSVMSGETKEINEFDTGAPQRGFEQAPFKSGQVGLMANVIGLDIGSPLGTEQGTGTRLMFTYSSIAGRTQK